MIDWVTAVLPCKHDPSKLISGMVMSFDASGKEEWTVNKKLSVEVHFPQKYKLNLIRIIKFGFQVIPQNFYKVIIFSALMIFVL